VQSGSISEDERSSICSWTADVIVVVVIVVVVVVVVVVT